MKLSSFAKANLDSYYPSQQLELSLFCNFVKEVLNYRWLGGETIKKPFIENDWVYDIFSIEELTNVRYGDLVEARKGTSTWYAIFMGPDPYISETSNNPNRWLWQPNFNTSSNQMSYVLNLEERFSAYMENGWTVTVYRPLNTTNIFEGNRENDNLDSGSEFDYPTVNLIKNLLADKMDKQRAATPSNVVFFNSSVDQGGPGNSIDLNVSFAYLMSRMSTRPGTTTGNLNVFNASGDSSDGGLHISEVQTKLSAGPGISIENNIVSYTGTINIIAALIPIDDNTYQIITNGDRSTDLFAYGVDSTLTVVAKATGTYSASGDFTSYTIARNLSIGLYALSTENTAVSSVLTFDTQVQWTASPNQAGYTKADIDQFITNINNSINAITNVIYNWGADKITPIPRGNINIFSGEFGSNSSIRSRAGVQNDDLRQA